MKGPSLINGSNIAAVIMSDTDSDNEGGLDLFAVPDDYYPPSPKPTTAVHILLDGLPLTVRLVGHNPLWGHHLWNAGRVTSTYFEKRPELVRGKTVLELGAAAGVPSMLASKLGAKKVVVTDYPDNSLIENLVWNIEHCETTPAEDGTWEKKPLENIVAEGYLWGADPAPLLAHLPEGEVVKKFDVLILADLLFNHSEHAKLLSSIQQTLSLDGVALVFFTPYRPWLYEKDLDFFRLADEGGFVVEKVLEEKMEKVMFEEDRGDEELRRTVYGYKLTW